MTNFYRKTAVLWILTRVLLIVLLIASIVLTYLELGLHLQTAISFLLLGIYLFLLGFSFFGKKTQSSGRLLLLTTGIFTLIYGLLGLASIVKIHIYIDWPQIAVMLVFCFWLLLFGLGDILTSRKIAD